MKVTVQAAARQAGISEARLRTWERRYGVPSPGRSATGRRLYDEGDIALIRRMARLVDSGVPAAQAAEAARDGEVAAPPQVRETELHPLTLRIATAARTLDGLGAYRALRSALEEQGWARALEAVVFPAFNLIGHEWERGEVSPAHEHFLSELVRGELQVAFADLPRAEPAGPLIILACPEDERHDLGLLALRLMIGQRGGRVLYLGTDLPPEALVLAVRDVRPAAVCLAATTPSAVSALNRCVRALIASRADAAVFIGGPATASAASDEVPAVRLPAGLEAAADLVMTTVAAAVAKRSPRLNDGE